MGRLSLLSLGLFILPVGITIGILVGIETYAVSHGQIGLGPIDAYNGVQTNTYCQKAFGVSPPGNRFIREWPSLWMVMFGETKSEAYGMVPSKPTHPNRTDRQIQTLNVSPLTLSTSSTVNPNQWGTSDPGPNNILCLNVSCLTFTAKSIRSTPWKLGN